VVSDLPLLAALRWWLERTSVRGNRQPWGKFLALGTLFAHEMHPALRQPLAFEGAEEQFDEVRRTLDLDAQAGRHHAVSASLD
jgi:hypothetical protein